MLTYLATSIINEDSEGGRGSYKYQYKELAFVS